jgi:phosphoribosylglycinamide formyltransferase-1
VGTDLIVLAGFMRILTPRFVSGRRGRIINVHPSLLPAFPGIGAVAQALDEAVELTGVTVHFVDEGVDTGPIIAQREVPVLAGDDEATLHARIQGEEHRLLPSVVADLIARGAGALV